jgi:glutathione synthase/RimK-type ligase-like ATP-grasp enzyme
MPNGKVLIISLQDDYHARVMYQWLQSKCLIEPVLFDLWYFPREATLISDGPSRIALTGPGIDTLWADDIISVWWRRASDFSFQETLVDRQVRKFCSVNCQHAIEGFFQILGDRVVDPILQMRAANRKLYQLHLAEACGLTTPPTCVTNAPDIARTFITTTPGKKIYKIFEGTGGLSATTTLVEPRHIDKIHLLRHSPVIFQQFIEPGFDLRITVVGNELFPAKITSRIPEAQVDIRADENPNIVPYVLPSDIDLRVRKLVAKLQLRYCAIDMRVSSEGEFYFLEVNPSGQYLFVEIATLQPITAALARLLANPTEPANYMTMQQ